MTSSKKLNSFEYYISHCIMTGFQSINSSFKIWCDLMTSNYYDYAVLPEDDAYEECRNWFWTSLGEDNTYPKEFLEYLFDLSERVDRGEEELINFTSLDELFLEELFSNEKD